jgi:hypothetical protein
MAREEHSRSELTMETISASISRPVPTGCCPPFDPAAWRDREQLVWSEEPFVTARVRTFFHVPLGFGRRVVEIQKLIEAVGAAPAEPLMLCDEESRFATQLYVHVTKPVPGAKMACLSGTFLTKVFEGPYRDARLWVKEMHALATARGTVIERLYFAYTTCPTCAKAYGKNYVVGFARVNAPGATPAALVRGEPG